MLCVFGDRERLRATAQLASLKLQHGPCTLQDTAQSEWIFIIENELGF